MSDLALDLSGSSLEGTRPGDLVLTSGIGAVAQRIAVAVETWSGEWVFDRSYGLDARGRVLRKGATARVIEAEFRRVVLELEGVVRFRSFRASLSSSSRALSVLAVVETDEGLLEVSGGVADITAPMWSLHFSPLQAGWI